MNKYLIHYRNITAATQDALNQSLKKALIMERIYWTISIFCILAFAAMISGCGGSSQEQDQKDLASEAQERCHELNPTFIGPCGITDPAAYLAANGPVVNHP